MTVFAASRFVDGMRGGLNVAAELKVFDHQGQPTRTGNVEFRPAGSDVESLDRGSILLPRHGGRIQIRWRLRMNFSMQYQVGNHMRTAFLEGRRAPEWTFFVHPMPRRGGVQRISRRSGGSSGMNVNRASIMSLDRNESMFEIVPGRRYPRVVNGFDFHISMANTQQSGRGEERGGRFEVGGGGVSAEVSGSDTNDWGGSWQTGASFSIRIRLMQRFRSEQSV